MKDKMLCASTSRKIVMMIFTRNCHWWPQRGEESTSASSQVTPARPSDYNEKRVRVDIEEEGRDYNSTFLSSPFLFLLKFHHDTDTRRSLLYNKRGKKKENEPTTQRLKSKAQKPQDI